MYLKQTVFLVAGISGSGIAATEFLLNNSAKCYIFDEQENESVTATAELLEKKGAISVKKEQINEIIDLIDVLVLSPGVPIDNHLPVTAKLRGKRIIGEMELGGLFCCAPIIAVTGTNGKTTTCSMLESVFTEAKQKNFLVGNIGIPFTSKIEEIDMDSVVIAEVSSFQLETLASFRPHIALVTNVAEEHLSRHYNMENYIYLKSKMLLTLTPSEFAVLNYDDETVRAFSEKAFAKTVFFSIKEEVDGAYVKDGSIMFKGEKVMELNGITLSGQHNLYNALATVCVAKIMGVSSEVICVALSSFRGVKHRIELIANINDVDYYNDSKATNINSTENAVATMGKETILLLGGKDKGQDFVPMFEKLKNSKIVSAIMFGESRFKMLDAAIKVGYLNIGLTSDMKSAVYLANRIAKKGQAILLSPACSSFDAYRNFEERGEAFVETVKELC